MSDYTVFPYSAIVGQNNFKLALELSLVDRTLGGVLVSGDKGTGKTTTVRSLSALLREGNDFPFVNLPVGASEDRVLGSVDIEKLINEKRQVLQRGLLAQAHGGILYIDEVNLLPDYLTDVLLDAAATGGYYLEREGLSAWQPSRFSLVGTMNPEEGALRPQLLDRFGLGVDVKTPHDIQERSRIAQRRIAFDTDAVAFTAMYAEQQRTIRERLLGATAALARVQLPESCFTYASELCLRHGVEGVRADVLLVKAGRAYAALHGGAMVTPSDIDAVAPFVLRHRSKTPPPPSGHTPEGSNGNGGQQHQEQQQPTASGQSQPQALKAAATTQGVKLFRKQTSRAVTKGKVAPVKEAAVARPVGRPTQECVDILKSVVRYTATGKFEVVYKPKQGQGTVWVIFLIDSSASMMRDRQIQYCKGIIEHTLRVYSGKRVCFAGVGLLQGVAEVVHAGTTDVQVFAECLAGFQSGGRTNLTAGFHKVSMLLRQNHRARQEQKQLYIFTDGRINAAMTSTADPVLEAVDYYHKYLKGIGYTQVLNTEHGFVKLGKAQALADQLRVAYANVA